MFIDYAKIFIKAGDGGNGAVAFRREKFVPKGGPAGGNGGNGGNVVFLPDSNLHTLLDFRYNKKYVADNGNPGGTSLKDGKTGQDIVIKVPVGTILKNADNDEIIADLNENGVPYIAAKGGRGGKGNSNFKTPTNQTPRFAEDGKPGEEFRLILELKLIADIGLVGFPNAGKSTFISTVSAARPKIADYPFTTLQPNLGIVKYSDYQNFTVADIPGIIEGAHEGKGLGHQFLRHIERTGILLIMIESISEDHLSDYNTLISELENYSSILAGKQRIIAITKMDIASDEDKKVLEKLSFPNKDEKVFKISSASGEGIKELLDYLWQRLSEI